MQPIGPGGRDDVILFEKQPDGLAEIRHIVLAYFVRLCGRYGFPRDY